MRVDEIWIVTDPREGSTLEDICFRTSIEGLQRQFAGGLSADDHPAAFSDKGEAVAEAKNRLLAWRVAMDIRRQRDLPADEVVKVVLHGDDGRVVGEWEVR